WWLPQLYMRRSVALVANTPDQAVTQTPTEMNSSTADYRAPERRRYGFAGRALELLTIERHLQRGRIVILHGLAGIGKSALARETADWLTRTRLYGRASFVSFEHGGSAAVLLSALGHDIGLHDGQFNPSATTTALEQVRRALGERPTLVVVDNLETILTGGD